MSALELAELRMLARALVGVGRDLEARDPCVTVPASKVAALVHELILAYLSPTTIAGLRTASPENTAWN